MCFSTPNQPAPPPVPDADAEAARSRRAAEVEANRAQRGRAATIVTSPLGDPGFGDNIRRTMLGGR